MIRTVSPAISSAGAVLIAGAMVLTAYDLGPDARHMVAHIVSMSVAAPLLAAVLAIRWKRRVTRPALLWTATLLQIVMLWAWHAPAIYNAVASAPLLQAALHAGLFAIATLFWLSLLTIVDAARWQSIPALLMTGKLACLLAALLIFAPRTLYDAGGHLSHAVGKAATIGALDDQHLAGLLMITACPLSYLVAAVTIASQLISSKTNQLAVVTHPSVVARR